MTLLRATGLSVRFGGRHAVREVDLAVGAGEIVGLIGPNGAGKTTTFNALSGTQRCEGTVHLAGRDITNAPPHLRARLGLGRTFQRLEVFGSMTAFENVWTTVERRSRWTWGSARAARLEAKRIIERVGLARFADQRADALPTGQARLVEIGRALATNPSILLLDEPASGLDEHETTNLAGLLAGIAEEGTAILLVEHDIELVMQLCSTITVLAFGEVLATGSPAAIQGNVAVRDAYLGAMA